MKLRTENLLENEMNEFSGNGVPGVIKVLRTVIILFNVLGIYCVSGTVVPYIIVLHTLFIYLFNIPVK